MPLKPYAQRLDDLEHHHLVPDGVTAATAGNKWRALLTNSWVLLLAVGFLVITIVSVERLHALEPLEHGGSGVSSSTGADLTVATGSGASDFGRLRCCL